MDVCKGEDECKMRACVRESVCKGEGGGGGDDLPARLASSVYTLSTPSSVKATMRKVDALAFCILKLQEEERISR